MSTRRAARQHNFEQADLEVASIQRLLLPAKLPTFQGWQLASHYQPCDASGGDFFGFQTRDKNRLLLLVADVSGHGARAAPRELHADLLARLSPPPNAQRRIPLQQHVVGKHAGQFQRLGVRRGGQQDRKQGRAHHQVKVTTPLAGSS